MSGKLHWVEWSEYLLVEKQEEDKQGGKGSPRPGCVLGENPHACPALSGWAAPGGWQGFRAAAPSVGSCRDHGFWEGSRAPTELPCLPPKWLWVSPGCGIKPLCSNIELYGGGGLVAKSCPTHVTPWTVACQAPLSMGLSRQGYWSGLPFFFQGIFPTQELNSGLLHCRQILYQLSYEGSPRII